MQVLRRVILTIICQLFSFHAFSDGGTRVDGGGPSLLLKVKASSFSNLKSEIILKDAVDIRLVSNEVLDIHQLQDRFPGKVLQDGKYLKVSRKLPLSDYQNLSGEVIRLK